MRQMRLRGVQLNMSTVHLIRNTGEQEMCFTFVASGILEALDRVLASSRYTVRRSDRLGSAPKRPETFSLHAYTLRPVQRGTLLTAHATWQPCKPAFDVLQWTRMQCPTL